MLTCTVSIIQLFYLPIYSYKMWKALIILFMLTFAFILSVEACSGGILFRRYIIKILLPYIWISTIVVFLIIISILIFHLKGCGDNDEEFCNFVFTNQDVDYANATEVAEMKRLYCNSTAHMDDHIRNLSLMLNDRCAKSCGVCK